MGYLALIIFIACSQSVFAGFTAKELEKVSKVNELLFEGYVGGVSEALTVTGLMCPVRSTFNDVARVVRSSLRKAQLEDLNRDAIYFVIESFAIHYPCTK